MSLLHPSTLPILIPPIIETIDQEYKGESSDQEFQSWRKIQRGAYNDLMEIVKGEPSSLYGRKPDANHPSHQTEFLLFSSREHLLINCLSKWSYSVGFDTPKDKTKEMTPMSLDQRKEKQGAPGLISEAKLRLIDTLKLGLLLNEPVQSSYIRLGVLCQYILMGFRKSFHIIVDRGCTHSLLVHISPVSLELTMRELSTNYEKYGNNGEINIRREGNFVSLTLTNECKVCDDKGAGYHSSGKGLNQLKEMIELAGGSFSCDYNSSPCVTIVRFPLMKEESLP